MAEGTHNLPHGRTSERPKDRPSRLRRRFVAAGGWGSIAIAGFFFLVAAALLMLRAHMPTWRVGQTIDQPLRARVDFVCFDPTRFATARAEAREAEPRIYKANPAFSWDVLEEELKLLPDVVTGKQPADLASPLRSVFDSAALLSLSQYTSPERRALFGQCVEAFIQPLHKTILLSQETREEEFQRQARLRIPNLEIRLEAATGTGTRLAIDHTQSAIASPQFCNDMSRAGKAAFEGYHVDLPAKLVEYVRRSLKPTHVLDEQATLEAQEGAILAIPRSKGDVAWKSGAVLKGAGAIEESDLPLLQAEHNAYLASLPPSVRWQAYLGIASSALVITLLFCWYVARFQPRIIRNHARAGALAMLLLGMLATAQIAAVGTRPIYFFGIAPTLLVTMITAIAYDRRFALGVGILHAVLVTMALGQDVSYLCVLFSGVCVATAMLADVRTRGRLIEAGVLTGLTMGLATLAMQASPLLHPQPFGVICGNALQTALAAVAVGFVVLGILPFIEKAFRITTGMTLIELADAGHPLQRRLATEAPGTYSHSLQVATLAETAAEAIGADALLTRVGTLYHDIGKTRKAEFFCENQGDGANRHMSLSPQVSLQIILGHVRDGVQLAREFSLPTALHPFIQQHHGTTVVEYFYHQAKAQGGAAVVEESLYRYSGPKPRSRETAVLMICDACESACRALPEPTPQRLHAVVHDLVLKRLLDGQFSECELSLQELDVVERTVVRSLTSIYHARVAYPGGAGTPPTPQIRSA